MSPLLQADSLPTELQVEPRISLYTMLIILFRITHEVTKSTIGAVQSLMCLTLGPHELQQPSYLLLTPGVCSNSRPFSQWCHPTTLPSVTCFFSCTQSFPASVFSNEVALCIWWPKYWSFNFSISPPSEYSGLISFRIDWFDVLYVQRTLKSLLAPELKNISTLERSCHYLYHRVCSLL